MASLRKIALGLGKASRLQGDARPAVERAKIFSLPFLEKWRAAPVEQPGLGLAIAISDPAELTAVRAWKFVTGVDTPFVIATHEEIDALLDELRRASPEADEIEFSTPDDDAELRDLAAAEPVVRLCNRLIADASRMRASDIHIEREERDYRIRFRIDGATTTNDLTVDFTYSPA